jgi:dihydrofolate synthase/folylpolyglutamate synthase
VGDELARAARAVGAQLERVPQAGTLAERNAALARAALDALGRRGVVGPAAGDGGAGSIAGGGSKLGTVGGHLLAEGALPGLPGRLERRDVQGVPVVLDGAHVPSSLRAVLAELEGAPGLSARPVVVFGTARDKDAAGLLKALRGRVDRVLCTSTGAGPVRTPEELLRVAAEVGVEAQAVSAPRDALLAALGRAHPDGWVLVTGSLHLVGAVRGQVVPASEDSACSRSSPTCS